jgi:hypothetical protein
MMIPWDDLLLLLLIPELEPLFVEESMGFTPC